MDDLMDRFRLDGRTALVSGVGPGIGAHVARAFGRAGARVVLCARTGDRLAALAGELHDEGVEACAVVADVGKDEGREALIAATRDRVGTVHILFNNASATSRTGGLGVLDVTDDDWFEHVNVNLMAPYRLAAAFMPGMVDAGYGRIINVVSTAAFTPLSNTRAVAYGCTKAGLVMMTRYIAKECGPAVRANMICPGTIEPTGQLRESWVPMLPRIPVGRVGAADEVVGAALLLASEASSYINGQVIFVDGGRVSAAS